MTSPAAAPPDASPADSGPVTAAPVPAPVPDPAAATGSALGATRIDISYDGQTRTASDLKRDPAVPGMVRADVGALALPRTKGPWLGRYSALATAGQLQAIVDVSSDPAKAALWQKRAPTTELRRLWLVRVGWPNAKANTWWNEAGGDAVSGQFKPTTQNGVEAQIDHVVELQLGGTNVPENLAPHDGPDNMDSGRKIFGQVSGWAKAVKQAAEPVVPGIRSVAVVFSSVTQDPPYPQPDLLDPLPSSGPVDTVAASRKGKAASALQVHFTALRDASDKTRPSADDRREAENALGPLTDSALLAGPNTATLRVPSGDTEVAIENSDIEANLAARELIAGITLEKLVRRTNPNQVIGWFGADQKHTHAPRSGTRVPISVAGGAGKDLTFDVSEPEHRLRLKKGGNGVEFIYPYLSRGRLDLTLTEQGLEGDGSITPSVPLLSRAQLKVHLAQDRLEGSASLDKSKLTLPAPLRVTDAGLVITLAPTLSVDGRFGVAVGDLLDAQLTAGVDADGLFARGTVRAHLPHLDESEGVVEYRPGTGLSGFVVVGATPGAGPVHAAQVRLAFDPSGFAATGFVELALPGAANSARLEVRRHQDRLLYAGRAHLEVPGLHPVDAEIQYDGEHIEGSAKTTFQLLGATGDLSVRYRDGHFSGDGKAALQRGKFAGSLDAHLDNDGRISGKGQGSYTFRPGLVGSAAVELTPDHKLHVAGEMRFPPYQLFDRHGDRYQLLHANLPPIPLFGFSLGPLGAIGIVATVGAGLAADYWFGPGVIRDIVVSAAFDPLEDDTNLDLKASAHLAIPAHAGLVLTGRLGLGLSAAVATLTGGVDLSAGLAIEGGLDAGIDLRFYRGVLSVDALAEVRAQPVLTLSLGVDFEIDTPVHTWTWGPYNLASFRYDTGLMFGMAVPLHYATDEPFRLPSVQDIKWTTPNIDVAELASRIGERVRDYVDQ